jgi:hypothetical protein
MMRPPSLSNVADQLRGLIAGRHTRQEVAEWAAQWLTADHPGVEDRIVWRTLEALGAADLKTGPDEYLYGESDFHAWLDAVEDATDGRH